MVAKVGREEPNLSQEEKDREALNLAKALDPRFQGGEPSPQDPLHPIQSNCPTRSCSPWLAKPGLPGGSLRRPA